MAKKGGVGKRGVGGKSNTKRSHKQHLRAGFEARHIDQVWDDVRSQVTVITTASDGTRRGPVGTTAKAVLDEDTPARGDHYCLPCARYFVSEVALHKHTRGKPHKRRVSTLADARRPHSQADAEAAAGMGAPDNGAAGRRSAGGRTGPAGAADVVEGGLAGMAL